MPTLQLLLVAFAVYMLVRYVPATVRLVRSPEHRAGAVVPLVNVLLAVVILAAAVKGLVGGLISR